MGILIGCEHLSHEWPGKRVLDDETIGIEEGDRIGIVGANGDGKSTLLSLIAHTLEPDSGAVTWRGGIRVGLLGQTDELADDATVSGVVVGERPEYEWASDPRTREIIGSLLADVDWDAAVGTLSGGQRRRVDLCRLLVGDWDVLALDEPTNHLDMRAITWLADHLRNRWRDGEGALLCVTNDRWFLDEVCQRMWEVHDGTIDPFEGGYSAYIQQRVERARQAAAHEERRQNMLRRELAWLSRGAQARSSKPKFRIAEAQAAVADVPALRDPIELKRLAVSRLGKQVFEMKDVSVGFGDLTVLDHVSWLIGPGDRYGILGENGAGKSTLLKVIQGRIAPSSGSVKVGKSVKIGTLSQHLDLLSDKADWRVSDLLARYHTHYVIDGKEVTPTQLLERLGFGKRETSTPIGDFSGGQRRRLALMCVLLSEPNVLVLDEPGNDLDTDMLAVMEDLLDGWPGTLLLVSHDRYLMERVTDDQFALLDGHLRHVPGGVDEYLHLLDERDARRQGAADDDTDATAEKVDPPHATAVPGMSNAERRDLKHRFDAVTRRLEKLSGEPDRLRIAMGEAEPTDYVGLEALQDELDQTNTERSELEDEWLELSETLGIE
ncbi:MAG: ABC-F family ATP-binding cassette domain-containing protein [Atopobiaceae bacterium]|nr:ABC-F family ATP-binding cassette domain-containing protein [Atopobiaceae bacterium]